MCGSCKIVKLSGDVEMNHQGGIRAREIAAGKFLPCCSTADRPGHRRVITPAARTKAHARGWRDRGPEALRSTVFATFKDPARRAACRHTTPESLRGSKKALKVLVDGRQRRIRFNDVQVEQRGKPRQRQDQIRFDGWITLRTQQAVIHRLPD